MNPLIKDCYISEGKRLGVELNDDEIILGYRFMKEYQRSGMDDPEAFAKSLQTIDRLSEAIRVYTSKHYPK